jgi:hypothetical protein
MPDGELLRPRAVHARSSGNVLRQRR